MTQRETACQVIPFPAAKRTGRIQRVAGFLSTQRGRGGEAYWQRITDDMHRQMTKAGIDPDTIARELEEFRRAVAGAMVQGGAA
ncbi:DUF6074 family protein [Ancylobacter sp. VNQ12]|uniref:DUF6074 family protein n=1 Tax=Ancylobacter sp. VNQ12 TaxID=3400920 RepID=UPI003C01FA25